MNSAGPPPGTRSYSPDKSAPALRRSCEPCRASKSRCCPSKDDITHCQRCVRDGKDCMFLETKPRPKRIRTSRTRVAEMEQKLDGIFAMLSASKGGLPTEKLEMPNYPYPTPLAISDERDIIFPEPTGVSNIQPFTMITADPPLKSRFDGSQDVIGKKIISYDKAETLLRSHGTHASSFPFILLSPTVSLDFLRREKPFLLLAILTITSTSDQVLQDLLEEELRETLGRKVIFNGEKSLDLLQGLLIYLAWYHLFFSPTRQQIYQLSQMVIAMAVELEISKSGCDLSSSLAVFDFGDTRKSFARSHKFPSELEAMRTFLGCYYLSSCLSVAFRKPNHLKYTNYIDICCQALNDAQEAPSDYLLPYFIRVQRLAEEINTTFDYAGHQELPPLDAARTEMLLKAFRNQLKQFEESFPSIVWHNVALRMAFLHVNVYVNEIGLHASKPDPMQSISAAQANCHDWYYSAARTETLVACTRAAKKYVEAYIGLSNEDLSQNTVLEEIKVIYAVLVMGRFTSGVDSPFLDAPHLRATVNLHHYISALIERLGKMITVNEIGRERVNYIWHFRRIMRHTKDWYEKQVKGEFFTTLEQHGLSDYCDLSFTQIFEMSTTQKAPDNYLVDAPEFQATATASEEDLWTVAMLEAWPMPTLDPRLTSFDGGFQ